MNLREKYYKEVLPQLAKDLNKNIHAVPRLEKIILNVGVGKDSKDSKYIDTVVDNLLNISGQKPVRTKAKKSISNFKLREGSVVGVKVTLRKQRMFDFLERLLHITFPRVRDFAGVDPKSIDGQGNLNIGFKEQIPFPEIVAEAIERIHGLELTINISAENKDDAMALYNLIGIPFKK